MSARIEMPATITGEAVPKLVTQREYQQALDRKLRLDKLHQDRENLRDDIKRGKECLDKAQQAVAESRVRLEEWRTYEQRCSLNCLPPLLESLLANRRVERFLKGWLRRQEKQLETVEQAISLFTPVAATPPRAPRLAVRLPASSSGAQLAQAA
jgi:hypothetical protein